jgi:multidrug efflux pump
MEVSREKLIFEVYPVPKALGSMVLPTIISQIILVLYNLADTWFVGLSGNANAIAAISVCLPIYNIMAAISNLYGIGGGAVFARALGMNRADMARKSFTLSVAGASLTALSYSLIIYLAGAPLLTLIGANRGDVAYAVSYSFWSITVGAIPTVLSPTLAHLIRAAGMPRRASFGMALGALLNIVLDPIFMFVILPPGNEVTGAAIATTISHSISLIFFLIFLFRRGGIMPKSQGRTSEYGGKGLLAEIVGNGFPGFVMVSLAMFSNCFLNSALSTLGSEAVAGLGIVRRIDLLAFAVNQGVTQGMLPIAAYCYASGRFERMKKVAALAAASTFGFSMLSTSISLIFAPSLVGFFIQDAETIRWGAHILRIICLAIPVYSLTFVAIALFQAAGKQAAPLALAILHKGSLDVVLLLIIRQFGKVEHVLWATPMTEVAALIAAGFLLYPFMQSLRKVKCGREPIEPGGRTERPESLSH